MRITIVLVSLALVAPAIPAQTADLILANAIVYTGEGLARNHPRTVEALAVANGKILAIGTNAEITRLKDAHTEFRDLDSARTHVYAFPGFAAGTHLGPTAIEKLRSEQTTATTFTPAQLRRGIQLAIADELARGVTSVDDTGDEASYRALLALQRDSHLNLRITEFLPASASRSFDELPPANSLLTLAPITNRGKTTSRPSLAQLARAANRGKTLSSMQAGLLLPGRNADFILLDGDLFNAASQQLLRFKTLETFVAGRQVFLADVHVQ